MSARYCLSVEFASQKHTQLHAVPLFITAPTFLWLEATALSYAKAAEKGKEADVAKRAEENARAECARREEHVKKEELDRAWKEHEESDRRKRE